MTLKGPQFMKLDTKDITNLLRRILSGQLKVYLSPDQTETWDDVYAGNCEFIAGKYRFTVFNDCDSVDYLDSVGYGGKKVDFNDLYEMALWKNWSFDDDKKLEQILKEARWE